MQAPLVVILMKHQKMHSGSKKCRYLNHLSNDNLKNFFWRFPTKRIIMLWYRKLFVKVFYIKTSMSTRCRSNRKECGKRDRPDASRQSTKGEIRTSKINIEFGETRSQLNLKDEHVNISLKLQHNIYYSSYFFKTKIS